MKKVFYSLLSFLMVFLVTACGSSNTSTTKTDQPAAKSSADQGAAKAVSGTINLYTSESQDLVNDMINDFKAKNPGVNVKIFRSGTGPVISKIEAEKTAGKIQADVIWFADIDYFKNLGAKGLLETYKSPEANGLDQRFVYDGGKYYEIRQIFNVIGYNTLKDKNPPKSWKDLADPSLKGKAAIANPNYSGAAFLTLATLVEDKNLGWDYFKTLKQNHVKFEESNGKLTSKVSNGEYNAVSVVDFMVRNAKKAGSPVDTVWPAEGAVLIPTPVGIINTSANKPVAEKLVDYLLSNEGQKFFVKQGYIPVKPDAGVPDGAPNVKGIKTYPLDLDYVGQNRDNLKKTFKEVFGEAK